jgi:23S rRNA (pseudouridine1915-N3)-methyltransferase
MKVLVAAIGRLKAGPERELFLRYWSRTEGLGRRVGLTGLQLIELPEGRAGDAATRRSDEAGRLLAAAGPAQLISLEVGGTVRTSEAFAADLRRRRDAGLNALAFLIGGPDGHGPDIAAAGATTLSLGALTLPHGLARVVLAEQLYRAATILAGHPYHRA